jgi:hypothetical protein
MSSFARSARFVASGVLTGFIGAMATAPALAQQKAAPPDFSSNQVGWVGVNGGGPGFEPVAGLLPPVSSDPAHPFVPNGAGRQPTYRIADLTNPNLQPWVKEHMKKDNDEVLAGKIAFTARSSCMPAGVPGFMAYGGANPVYFVQTPKQVWMVYSGDAQVRRIYLDVPHSEHPKPSWYASRSGTTNATPSSSTPSGLMPRRSSTLTARRTPKSCTWSSAGKWPRTAKPWT